MPKLTIGLRVLAPCLAAAWTAPASAQAVDYKGTFQSPTEDATQIEDKADAPGPKAPKSPKGSKDMFDEAPHQEAAAADSFPIWVSFDEALKPDWKAVPDEAQPPAKKTKRLKVKGCELTLETSGFTVNSYRITGINEYELEGARVAPRTTFQGVVGGPLFFSVSADLAVTMAQTTAAACRKLFEDNRRHVIPALEFTALPTGTAAGKRVSSTKTVREAHGDRLYVAWSKETQGPVLVNKEGSAPTTESAVVKFEPNGPLAFFLTFAPAWKIVRGTKLAAAASGAE